MRDAEEYKQELDMQMRERTKNPRYFVRWHILEFFVLSPAKRSPVDAPLLVFWNEIEGSRLLCVPYPLCLAYYSGGLFGDDDRNTQQVQQMLALGLVILTLGA